MGNKFLRTFALALIKPEYRIYPTLILSFTVTLIAYALHLPSFFVLFLFLASGVLAWAVMEFKWSRVKKMHTLPRSENFTMSAFPDGYHEQYYGAASQEDLGDFMQRRRELPYLDEEYQ